MPSRRAVAATRQAISPRFAMRIFLNMLAPVAQSPAHAARASRCDVVAAPLRGWSPRLAMRIFLNMAAPVTASGDRLRRPEPAGKAPCEPAQEIREHPDGRDHHDEGQRQRAEKHEWMGP